MLSLSGGDMEILSGMLHDTYHPYTTHKHTETHIQTHRHINDVGAIFDLENNFIGHPIIKVSNIFKGDMIFQGHDFKGYEIFK